METPLSLGFKLDQTFFGFDASYQVTLHENLFNLIWAGEGRWTWDDVYNLPVHIRKLWVANINKIRVKQNNDTESDTPTNNRIVKK